MKTTLKTEELKKISLDHNEGLFYTPCDDDYVISNCHPPSALCICCNEIHESVLVDDLTQDIDIDGCINEFLGEYEAAK